MTFNIFCRISELPDHIKEKYEILKPHYDKIDLEKVYTLNKKTSYEFYCYKNGELTKFEA